VEAAVVQFINESGESTTKSNDIKVVVRQGGKPAQEATEPAKSTSPETRVVAKEVKGAWVISTPIPLPPPNIVDKAPIATNALHPSISEFTRILAEIDGVQCIVAEDTEGHIIHFSIFAHPLSRGSRDSIYAAEAALIRKYTDQVFDFHLRDASLTLTGTPSPLLGQHFFAVWGTLDENSRRASPASKK
jgi:hypothetical protein